VRMVFIMRVSPSLLVYFLEVIGFFAMAAMVALRQRTVLYRNFSHFTFLVGTWQLLQFLAQLVAYDYTIAHYLLRASIFIAPIMASSFTAFARAYVGKPLHLRQYYLLGLAFGSITIFSTNLQHVKITHESIGVPNLDVYYGAALIYAAVNIFYGIGLIFGRYRKAHTQNQRNQDFLILLSTGIAGTIAIAGSFATSSFSQSAVGEHLVPTVCLFAMTGYLYAIFHHGLFDIKFFIARSMAYISSLVVLASLYGFVVFGIAQVVFGKHFTFAIQILMSLATGIATIGFEKLKAKFDVWTHRLFYRRYYEPQDVINKLSDLLVGTINIDYLQSESAEIIEDALGARNMQYWLGADKMAAPMLKLLDKVCTNQLAQGIVVLDEVENFDHTTARHLSSSNIALIVRLRARNANLGFITLGYKESGEHYTERDKKLLTIAADEIGISMQNAIHVQQIENFNATLQERINEATAKLRHANRRLTELDETKDDFISMASHQLRTPLTSVKGYLSLVIEGDAGSITPLQRKLLSQAFTSSQRMVYLIADLLNVSRLKTGKFIIDPVPTNLAHVVEEEVAQLQEEASSRSLALEYKKPTHFPMLMIDETKTRQVVMNFLDNALYYTPAGGRVAVELIDRAATVELRVKDNGMGVPKAEQHHLFTKFYRAGNARKARPDGTGLGLFMAKKVVIAQGGAIIFESREGQGSTFGFTLSKSKLGVPEAKPSTPLDASANEKQPVKV
jgi:signal transduction histidine kinase